MKQLKEIMVKTVDYEVNEAKKKFPMFASAHEGYAVALEECCEAFEAMDIANSTLEEVWEGCRKNESNTKGFRDILVRMRDEATDAACEAVQWAAVAQKMLESLEAKDSDVH